MQINKINKSQEAKLERNRRERERVPLKRWTSGFYSTPQVDELPDRNSESRGTKSQCLHTFLQYFKLQNRSRAFCIESLSLPPRKTEQKQSNRSRDNKPGQPKVVGLFNCWLSFRTKEREFIYIYNEGVLIRVDFYFSLIE